MPESDSARSATGIPAQQLLIERFHEFSGNATATELDAALLIVRVLGGDVELAGVVASIDLLEQDCGADVAPWDYLHGLGFAGNSGHFNTLEGSRLDLVIARRRGIPIALGVLLIQIARSRGYMVSGINFPGRFLVRVDGQLIDPLQMKITSESACLAEISADSAVRSNGPFAPMTPTSVLLRMLNNLKYHFVASAAWDEALNTLDYQMVLAPASPRLLLEKGEFWSRLGAMEMARTAYAEAAEAAANSEPELATVAGFRVAALADARDIVN